MRNWSTYYRAVAWPVTKFIFHTMNLQIISWRQRKLSVVYSQTSWSPHVGHMIWYYKNNMLYNCLRSCKGKLFTILLIYEISYFLLTYFTMWCQTPPMNFPTISDGRKVTNKVWAFYCYLLEFVLRMAKIAIHKISIYNYCKNKHLTNSEELVSPTVFVTNLSWITSEITYQVVVGVSI